jgi:hypothetical protein
MPPDPIILHYILNPGVPPPERSSAWDIDIKMEDTSLKSRMAVIVQSSKESTQDLGKLDDEVNYSTMLPSRVELTSKLSLRLHSLRNHCITRILNGCSCRASQMTQQCLFRRGWSPNREIWRVFLGVGPVKAPPSAQKSFGEAISSDSRGSKRPLQFKKACAWLRSNRLRQARRPPIRSEVVF